MEKIIIMIITLTILTIIMISVMIMVRVMRVMTCSNYKHANKTIMMVFLFQMVCARARPLSLAHT